MPNIFTFKLKAHHVLFGLLGCALMYWTFLYGTTLQPSNEWVPLAGLVLKPKNPKTAREHLEKSVNNKIPKIIHQTWKDYNIPELMEPWVKKCVEHHPDWEYWFWTDEDIRKLVQLHFAAYLPLFDSYPASGYRADVFRYLVLYEYGGVYIDLDMECLKPMDTIIEEHSCIVSQEPLYHAHFLSPMHIPLISNAMMACHRGHDFFGHVINDLHSYTGWLKWNDILRSTGPYMLTEIYKGYTKAGFIFSSTADPLYLADADDFQPTTDPSMRDHMRDACIHSEGHTFLSKKYLKRQEELCSNILKNGFRDRPGAESYTDHHWTHTWAGRRNDPWGIMNNDRTFNVKDLKRSESVQEKKSDGNKRWII